MAGNLGTYQMLTTVAKKFHGPAGLVTALIGGGAVLGAGTVKLGSWGVRALKKHSVVTLVYPAVFDNVDNEGQYTVTFPDVPDTVSQGSTLEDAFKAAPDALAVALPDYKEHPTPSSIEEVQAAYPEQTVLLVSVSL